MKKLRRFLKQQFVPHQGNDHRPHFLSIKSVAAVFLLVFLLEAALLSQIFLRLPGSNFLAAVLPSVLTDYTNEDRQKHGVGALKVSPKLEEAAKLKANDMALKGYFSHTTPEGQDPWYFLKLAGYEYQYAGENLAVNFVESRDVETAWMNSEGHRANIINASYTEIGIATAQGVYQGRPTIFVVQFFGTPRVVSVPVAVTPKPVPQVAPVPASRVLGEEADETALAVNQDGLAPAGAGELLVKAVEAAKAPFVATAHSTLGYQFATNPRWLANAVLSLLLLIVLLALILKIFIKPKIQYPLLIANGVMLFVAIAGALYLNHFIFSSVFNGLIV